MTYNSTILVDTGLLVAFYDSADSHHNRVVEFFTGCTNRLLTSKGCVTEVMWLLASDWQVQNEFLSHLANHIYECESLTSQDFSRINDGFCISAFHGVRILEE